MSPVCLEGLDELWDSWEKGLQQRDGGFCPGQSQIQPPAAWQSGDRGHLETLGSRCLNASGVGDYGKWPGAQGTLLDAQGWAGGQAELLPRGPRWPPQVWSKQSQQQLQTLNVCSVPFNCLQGSAQVVPENGWAERSESTSPPGSSSRPVTPSVFGSER